MFQTEVAAKFETNILYSKNFSVNLDVYERMWKVRVYCGVGQATDDNTVHAHCMLDT